MTKDFVSLIDHLKLSELESLKHQLNGSKIKYIVSGHGARSRYHSAYYEIKVIEEDYARAKRIANKFRAANFAKSRKCPKCGSALYEPVTGLNFFKRILYLGTTPVKCKKCKTMFAL